MHGQFDEVDDYDEWRDKCLPQQLARYCLYLPLHTHRRRPTDPRRLRLNRTLQVFVPTVSQETAHLAHTTFTGVLKRITESKEV